MVYTTINPFLSVSCSIGIENIALALGKSPSTISMRLKELVDGGYVSVKYRGQGRTAVIKSLDVAPDLQEAKDQA